MAWRIQESTTVSVRSKRAGEGRASRIREEGDKTGLDIVVVSG